MIFRKKLTRDWILGFSTLFAFTVSQQTFSNNSFVPVNSLKMQSHFSDELRVLDKKIQDLQIALYNAMGVKQIYITGGAARSILDHIYLNKPLIIRDLDIAIITNSELSGREQHLIIQSLEQTKIGTFISNSLDFRARVPSSIPFQADTEYYAGYGFFLLAENGMIVDLSFFENEANLDLNGLMDIDTVKIVLEKNETLIQFAEKAQSITLENLIKEKKILDPYQGYLHWIEKNPTIIHWGDIEADPQLQLFRLVRSYMKLNLIPLPINLWKTFHNLCASTKPKQSRRLGQYLLRILNDKYAHKELKLLQELGVFQCWIPEFDHWLEKANNQDLAAFLDNNAITSIQKLMLLILQLPEDKQLKTWFLSMYKFDLDLALERSFDLITGHTNLDRKFLKTCLKSISLPKREELENQLIRIMSSTIIKDEERFDLIIRSLVLAYNDIDPLLTIKNLLPDISNENLKILINKVKGKRKGVVTGVFDPIQNGHLRLINKSIEQLVLDEILIVPVEVDESRSTISWQDRITMIDLATKNIPESRTPSFQKRELIKESIGTFFEDYKKNLQKEDFFCHIMGSDAWKRYCKYELLNKEDSPLLIFYRTGFPFSFISQNKIRQIMYLDLKQETLDISCNDIRAMIAAHKPFQHLVPSNVADYITKKQLYTFNNFFGKPFYLADDNEALYNAAKHYLPTLKMIAAPLPSFDEENIHSLVEKKLDYAQKLGLQNLIVIENLLEIDCLNGLPGLMTKSWMKKITPNEFIKIIQTPPYLNAQLKVVIGFLGSNQEKFYVDIDNECDLNTLINTPKFCWENLFNKKLPNQELSLIDIAITRLVRDLYFKNQLQNPIN